MVCFFLRFPGLFLADFPCSRDKRINKRIQTKKISTTQYGDVVRISDVSSHGHMGNEEHTVQDLHDTLQSYYKVARKRFVDNLRMQVSDLRASVVILGVCTTSGSRPHAFTLAFYTNF